MPRTIALVQRTVLAALCAVLCLGALSGCAGSYPTVDEALSATDLSPKVTGATLEEGVLTVGINASNAPYSWATSSDPASLTGVDVDTALALGSELGLSVRFVNVGSNYEAASQGLCDVVMGVTSSTLPGSEVLEGAYAETAPALFGRNVTTTATAELLNGASVGVQEGSVSARTLENAGVGAQLAYYSTLNDAFAALEDGTVAYVACDSFMGGYLATGYTDIEFAGSLAQPESRGVAVAATNTALQSVVLSALDTLTSNGIQQAIRHSWVGDLAYISASNIVSLPEATVAEETWVDDGTTWDDASAEATW